jgi:hypothetical protein
MRTAAGVVIDPLQRVAVQRRPGPPSGLLRDRTTPDLARRAKCHGRSPALSAILEIDGHPPRAALVDARRRGALQRRRRLRHARDCHPRCHPNGFAPGRKSPPAQEICRARPRGFEPLTFGSVADAVARDLALASHFGHSDAPERRQKIRIAGRLHQRHPPLRVGTLARGGQWCTRPVASKTTAIHPARASHARTRRRSLACTKE